MKELQKFAKPLNKLPTFEEFDAFCDYQYRAKQSIKILKNQIKRLGRVLFSKLVRDKMLVL